MNILDALAELSEQVEQTEAMANQLKDEGPPVVSVHLTRIKLQFKNIRDSIESAMTAARMMNR